MLEFVTFSPQPGESVAFTEVESQLRLFVDERISSPALESDSTQGRRTYAFINHMQCAAVSRHLAFAAQSLERKDPFSLREKSRRDQIAALLFLVAICDRLNWDFLMSVASNRLWELTDGYSLSAISLLTTADLRKILAGYTRGNHERVNLHRKIRFLKELAERAYAVDTIGSLERCKSITGDGGATALLNALPVYSADPLHKKTNVLLHELVRRGLLETSDSEEIEPAIDYHLIRLYLRTGRVWVADEYLRKRLTGRGRVRIEAITQIRLAVAEAMRYTAWVQKLPITSLNELEWLFARCACRRDITWCDKRGYECPIRAYCPSSDLRPRDMLTEPESHHGYY